MGNDAKKPTATDLPADKPATNSSAQTQNQPEPIASISNASVTGQMPTDISSASIPQVPPSVGSHSSTTPTPSADGNVVGSLATPGPTGGEVTTVVTSPHAPQKYGGKKIIATIFGLLLVVGGITAGVALVQRQQNISERAQVATPSRQIDAQCSAVKAYDSEWNQLSADTLGQLTAGTVVRFTVSGTATSGEFDRARFTINGTQTPEVTTKKPGTEEFYYEYTLPEGIVNYTVSAQVHHNVWGWI